MKDDGSPNTSQRASMMRRVVPALGLLLASLWLMSCQANRLTDRLTLRDGPLLNQGRISSSLGALRLDDGRVVVIGGSPIEFPFKPITGEGAIEVLDAQWNRWETSGISLPYPISGAAFKLPNGQILAFGAVYDFNPNATSIEPYPKNEKHPQTGAVSAVFIDLNNKKYTPVYRPKGNDLSASVKPMSGQSPLTFAQRAFARSIQLHDGRIVRIGGRVLYITPPPDVTCEQSRCRYCTGNQCKAHPDGDYVCKDVAECPALNGKSEQILLKLIEIYTPSAAPGPDNPKRVYMDEGRRNVAALELHDGRVFITGGKGPLGDGPGEVYRSTYLLDPNTGGLVKGPPLRVGREDHSMALLNDGRVLITGGSDLNETSVNVTEIFDPTTELFVDGNPMDLSREDAMPVYLGPWVLFLGGENSGKADLIRNSGEAFDVVSGVHISSFFLYSRDTILTKEKLCPNTNGYAGVDDFAAVALDRTHVLLLGGQQGCQDRDGDYISPGKGTRRTLFIEFPPL